ncbi:hypothetical protein ABPG77_011386 [Micractinium sp. CCAP 211/92]
MTNKGFFSQGLSPMSWELEACGGSGLTLSQLRFTLAFVASVVVGAILRHVPTVKGRHIFSLASGFLLVYYPFGNGSFHAVIPSLAVYICMRYFRRTSGTLAWLIAFPYLILAHVMQASGAAWKEGQLDFTGAQMVLTLRLIAVAVSYQDGAAPPEGLREYAARKRLPELPSPLEFLSYLFAAGNLLAGPFFEARDFKDYVERKGEWDEADPAKRIPSPLLPGLARFVKGCICAVLWMKLSQPYGADLLESKYFQQEVSLPHRLFLLWMVGLAARCKYYFAWAVAESSLIFSGLCYNGRTAEGRPLWNRYINSRIRRVEFNPSLPNLAANWNVCTGLWLRHYVYERLTPAGKRPTFATLAITQLISGIWHGLFPGYWLFFATSAVMFEAGKTIYRYEQGWPPRVRRFAPYMVLKVVFNALILNYAASAFIVLWLSDCMAIWRSVYYCGHLAILAIIAAGIVLPPRKPKRDIKPDKAGRTVDGVDAAPAVPAVPVGAPVAPVAAIDEGKKDH